MNVTAYVKMNSVELGKEIEKQKKKMKSCQDTIKLLEKLQIAENAKTPKSALDAFTNGDT